MSIVVYIRDINNIVIHIFDVALNETLNILYEKIDKLRYNENYKLSYSTIIIDKYSIQSFYTIIQFINNNNISCELNLNLINLNISESILSKIKYNTSLRPNLVFLTYTIEDIQEYYNVIFYEMLLPKVCMSLLDDKILKLNINFLIQIFYFLLTQSLDFYKEIIFFFEKVKHLHDCDNFTKDLVFCFEFSINKMICRSDRVKEFNYVIIKLNSIYNNNILIQPLYNIFSLWIDRSYI